MQVTLVQSGAGAAFLGVGTGANITYAGGKNTTYIQGTGISNSNASAANVQYTTTGRGPLRMAGAPRNQGECVQTYPVLHPCPRLYLMKLLGP